MTATSFFTAAGIEVPAITTDQMREVDRIAIEEVGPNLYQMMENAGRNLALAAIKMLGADWRTTPIVVMAGHGGNGGGGICAARHLANRGADITVVVSDEHRLGEVPAEQLGVYRATAGRFVNAIEFHEIEAGLVLDAVIGYSLGGAPRGPALDMIDWMEGQSSPVISLDVPSGLDATTGEAAGVHVRASLTLTLALPKTGLDSTPVGELWLADIGIPREVYRRMGIALDPATFGPSYRVQLRTTLPT